MFRMPRADRRRWAEPTDLAGLGELMAEWLEGHIKARPGYLDYRPDPETNPIIPSLAALCRAGFLTDNSQPGVNEHGDDGSWWEQRAAVDGFIADQGLLDRLTRAARSASADTLVDDRRGVVVTTRNGEPTTGFGARVPRGHFRHCWPEVNRDALGALKSAHHVAFIARDFGPSGERLWPALAAAIR